MAIPFILGAGLLLGGGTLAAKVIGDETQQTISGLDRAAPNIALIGAIAVAGIAIWQLGKRRR